MELMRNNIHRLGALIHDERGTTAIEYSLIGSIVSIVAIAGITSIGTTTVNNVFGVLSGFLR